MGVRSERVAPSRLSKALLPSSVEICEMTSSYEEALSRRLDTLYALLPVVVPAMPSVPRSFSCLSAAANSSGEICPSPSIHARARAPGPSEQNARGY